MLSTSISYNKYINKSIMNKGVLKLNIYLYVLDTLADWEVGYLNAELNSGRFFKSGVEKLKIRTVSYSKNSIETMGGIKIAPELCVEDIVVSENSVIILPGANTWAEECHKKIIKKAKELLKMGGLVCAICGALVPLANEGLLDNYYHTSNGKGYLEMFSSSYKGSQFYIDSPSVSDRNLITAGSTSTLEFARDIIRYLDVFNKDTIKAWYNYFSNGKYEDFFELMNTLPNSKN